MGVSSHLSRQQLGSLLRWSPAAAAPLPLINHNGNSTQSQGSNRPLVQIPAVCLPRAQGAWRGGLAMGVCRLLILLLISVHQTKHTFGSAVPQLGCPSFWGQAWDGLRSSWELSWLQRWRGLSPAGFALCSLLEKSAGVELIHVLLPGQDQCDRLHRWTFLKSILELQRHRVVQLRVSVSAGQPVCVLLPSGALSSCLARQELCLAHMKLAAGPFPRSVHSAGSRTQPGALLGLWDAHRCDPIPGRR